MLYIRFIIIMIFAICFLSCQEDNKDNLTTFSFDEENDYEYEWVGDNHNEIFNYFYLNDCDLREDYSPGPLLDSIIAYLERKYNSTEQLQILDSLHDIYSEIIQNNGQLYIIPGDNNSHNEFFTNLNLNSLYQTYHYAIDNVMSDPLLVYETRNEALDSLDNIVDTLSINAEWRKILKYQIYIGKYSADYWQNSLTTFSLGDKNFTSLLFTEMNAAGVRDVNKHDADAAWNCATSVSSVVFAVITQGRSIPATAAAAVIEGTHASLRRMYQIYDNGWYGAHW